MVTDFFSGTGGPLKEKRFTSSSPKRSSKACFLCIHFLSMGRVSAHYMLTMNQAPGKSDLGFKWIFIQKHRYYLEIIAEDGGYVFNKWPRWKLLSRERMFSPADLFPSGSSQLHLPGLSLPPSSFSLEIKVSSCLGTSFRLPAPLANYSICLLQNYFTQFPPYSWCPNIMMYFLCSLLWDDNIDIFESDFSLLLKSAPLLSFTQPPTD